MRVGLLGEGTYPVVKGGVSTWSDQLVRGLAEVEFRVTVLTAGRATSVYDLPPNVRKVSMVDMWGPVPVRKPIRARHRGAFDEAWEVIVGHAFGRGGRTAEVTLGAWRVLARRDIAERLWWLLNDERALQLVDATRLRAGLRPSTGRDLVNSMAYVARMIMPCALPPIEADLVHVTSLGSALLAALPSSSEGVPILLSEHGVFFRERLMALRATEWSFLQRNMVTAFLKSITRVGYEAAESIAPVSDFNGRWARALGADPGRIATVYNGVDVGRFQFDRDEPSTPTLVFVGRIDPLKDLLTLVRAVPLIAARIPRVRVNLVGPIPDADQAYAESVRALIAELRVGDHVTLTGPTSDPVGAYKAGTVAVLSSISEGFPYGALEPMACGRPIVATRVGGVPEVVGDAGILVPAQHPHALAQACTRLLGSRGMRQRFAAAGRDRVEQDFSLERMVDRFRQRYAEVSGQAPVPQVAGIPRPREEQVDMNDRIVPYLPPQRDAEWAKAFINARLQG